MTLPHRRSPTLLTSGVAPAGLISDIRALIEAARAQAARAVNAGMVSLYWHIGRRIREDILKEKRAGYGERVVATLSAQLSNEYGQGFTIRNLFNMTRFAEVFPNPRIVHTLCAQLSWSHFRLIIYLKNELQRNFYAEMCRIEKWSVRALENKIGGMLYERTALSRKPARLAALELKKLKEEDELTPDLVFRDPYFLDFLGLKGAYQEKDIETAILREMESFIVELGTGFAFLARQKRMQIGPNDYYLDLLFYHRGLRRLVAIELKLDKFRPEYKGQMELYLRWLEKYERRPGEGLPIGLILCAGGSAEEIELLRLGRSGIRVAGYMTALPPRGVLERKLHEAVASARARLSASRFGKPGDLKIPG